MRLMGSRLEHGATLRDALAETLRLYNVGETPAVDHHRHQPPRLLVYVMEGCSGSTFVRATVKDLLKCHGHDPASFLHALTNPEEGELLKVDKVEPLLSLERPPFSGNRTAYWATFLETMDSWAAAQGKTVIINADFHCGSDKPQYWAPVLARLGARFVVAWRENVFDMKLCGVRDCFNTAVGLRVDGAKKHCMGRRNATRLHGAPPPLVKVNTEAMRKALQNSAVEAKTAQDTLRGFGLCESLGTCEVLTYEDLAAFQYPHANETGVGARNETSRTRLSASIDAWSTMLGAWGVGHTRGSIERCLQPRYGTRAWPSSHRAEIVNADEAWAVLHELGPAYERMWRP